MNMAHRFHCPIGQLLVIITLLGARGGCSNPRTATTPVMCASTCANSIPDEAKVTGELFESFQPEVLVTAVEFEISSEGVHLLTIDAERAAISLKAQIIRTEDAELLELAKIAFNARCCYHQFRALDTDGSWGGGSLDQPYGTVRIFTDKGVRSFGVSRYGFSRSNGQAGIKHGFFSAMAAEYVNVLYARKHSYSMPPLLLEGLSGERQLSADRKLFQAMREARASEVVE